MIPSLVLFVLQSAVAQPPKISQPGGRAIRAFVK